MQKISAFNQNNQPLEIDIIRYFKKDDKKYLIFTLGEKDDQGYIKIYVSKILGLNGTLAAYDIIDETEWAIVQDLIKKIIKMNREGMALEIDDLSVDRLFNIKINGQQAFKLMSNLIELLESNIQIKEDNEENNVTNIPKEEVEISESPTPVENANTQQSLEQDITPNTPDSFQEVVASNIEQPKEENLQTVQSDLGETSEYQILYKELFDKYQALLEENTKLKTILENIKSIIHN